MRVTHLRRHIVSALTFAFLSVTATVRVVQAAPIPSPWVAQDIGAPAVSGSSSYDSTQKAFTISAAGSDVWGTSDQFQFVYQQITGDVDIMARVDSLLQTDQWSKAGVMIRSSLAAGAAHGFALVSAQNGIAFQWRAQVNGQSAYASGGTGAAPRWVRLVTCGNQSHRLHLDRRRDVEEHGLADDDRARCDRLRRSRGDQSQPVGVHDGGDSRRRRWPRGHHCRCQRRRRTRTSVRPR